MSNEELFIKFHDFGVGFLKDEGERFITVPHATGEVESHKIGSKSCRDFLRLKIYEFSGEFINEKDLIEFCQYLISICELKGIESKLRVRTAFLSEDKIAVDSGDIPFVISEGGWEKRPVSFPLFKRYASMKKLCVPKKGGDVNKIFEFVNISDPYDRILFLTHLIFSFVPDLPHPVLVFHGPQGASKSTAMRMYMAIVDPNVTYDLSASSNSDFQLATMQRWVFGLDNISVIPDRLSDYLCKVVTGAGFVKRILYTTDELMSFRYNRVVLINGVSLPVDKPDLMDRSILLSLDRIDNSNRLDESTLNKNFESARGEILGGCFDALSKAIGILPTVPRHFNTRMTDYARWGCAIAQALGFTEQQFIGALELNSKKQNDESLDTSPLVSVLNFCFSRLDVDFLKGTSTDLLVQLRGYADRAGIESRTLPMTARTFGKRLAEIKANLEVEGYRISFHRARERVWTIEPPKELRDEYKKTRSSFSGLTSLTTFTTSEKPNHPH